MISPNPEPYNFNTPESMYSTTNLTLKPKSSPGTTNHDLGPQHHHLLPVLPDFALC